MFDKKVILFAPDFKPLTGGVAEYTYHLAKELNELNKLDRVITTIHQEQQYEFTVEGLNKQKHDRHLGKRPGDNIALGRKINSLIYFGKLYLFTLASFIKILIARKSTSLLITYTENLYSKIIIRLCNLLTIEYGVCIHGLDVIKLSTEDKFYLQEIGQNAKPIIFNSLATQNLFKSLFSDINSNSYLLYPGINTNDCERLAFFSIEQLEERFKINLKNKTIILSVARHIKRKGLDIGIKAAALLYKEYDNFIYLIAGDGAEFSNYKALITAHNLQNKVFLIEKITESEKFSLLNLSSIFLMPNRGLNNTDFEGFGISFIEASYFKNVIIGGRNGGAVEAVKDKITGFLVDTEQEKAEREVSNILKNLIDNPHLINKMGNEGKKYVLENFVTKNIVFNFAKNLTRLFVKSAMK
ncbi:MAG TPA: glycosyltransferase family 4 protein [Coleofasciculaceae cyanobacterium]|jgi:glycosyltransferase involved in cell wall biosynthesis